MANDVTSVLNGLIETCKDGEEGFRHAADKAKEASLKSLFTKYATQRATYATELQALVTATGETPSDSGHIAASLHRGWITLKESLAKDEDKALIDEAEAGEDAAMKAYKQAVAANLPVAVNTVVQQQFSGVQEAHGIIRDLKHNWTGSMSSTTAAV